MSHGDGNARRESRPAANGRGVTLRIGQVADRLGLTTRTLRYWEQRRLLPPAQRTPGGYRTYRGGHVEAAAGVLRLKAAGLSLKEIEAWAGETSSEPTALGGLSRLSSRLREREARLRARIRELEDLADELARSARRLDPCCGCNGKPLDGECISCVAGNAAPSLPAPLLSVLGTAIRGLPASPRHEDA